MVCVVCVVCVVWYVWYVCYMCYVWYVWYMVWIIYVLCMTCACVTCSDNINKNVCLFYPVMTSTKSHLRWKRDNYTLVHVYCCNFFRHFFHTTSFSHFSLAFFSHFGSRTSLFGKYSHQKLLTFKFLKSFVPFGHSKLWNFET